MEKKAKEPGFVMNDFHRKNSEGCLEAVMRMQMHPLSREEAIAQIKRVHEQSLARAAEKLKNDPRWQG